MKCTFVVPRLVIPERLISAMVVETLAFPITETGETMIGIEAPGLIAVLGTIPDALDTVRDPSLFRLGGADQVEVYNWYNSHWEAMRAKQLPGDLLWQLGSVIPKGVIPNSLNFPLAVVGDWHRHPGTYKVLSGTDMRTIDSILRDKEQQREQWLGPILIHDPNYQYVHNVSGQELVIAHTGNEFKVNWYFRHRGCPEIHQLTPEVVPDNQLPWIPPLPWHLRDIQRMRLEINFLTQAGCKVAWNAREAGGDPFVQEIVFGLTHPSWDKRLLIITGHDYPVSQPRVQIMGNGKAKAPAVQAKPPQGRVEAFFTNLNRRVWGRDQDIWRTEGLGQRMPWDKNRYLVDLVRGLDTQLKPQAQAAGQK